MKKALLLVLIGSFTKQMQDGLKIRAFVLGFGGDRPEVAAGVCGVGLLGRRLM